MWRRARQFAQVEAYCRDLTLSTMSCFDSCSNEQAGWPTYRDLFGVPMVNLRRWDENPPI